MVRWWMTVTALALGAVACSGKTDGGTSTKTGSEPEANGGASSRGAGGAASPDAATPSAGGVTSGSGTAGSGGGPAGGTNASAGGSISTGGVPSRPQVNWSDAGMCYPAVEGELEGSAPGADCPCLDPDITIQGTACINSGEMCRYHHGRRCWVAYCQCSVDASGTTTWSCPELLC
jgi:hypothetical protein